MRPEPSLPGRPCAGGAGCPWGRLGRVGVTMGRKVVTMGMKVTVVVIFVSERMTKTN